ncbi:MAG: Arabinose efflux permease [Myxococcales bacterium]|nr:Arabinose efflux permease [Myxococcales bacterium]
MLNLSERRVVFLVGAVQFINVLDFTMVMPLGPDFARSLGIPTSELGKVVAGYGQAAAISGFLGSFFLDRFDRRKVLAVAMFGLVLGTLAGGLAHDLRQLTMARIIAGFFGGPATSIAYAIIADVIPPGRRGKAMGAVMGAFSVAQVLGVPAALLVSQRFGWQMPFYAVSVAGGLVALLSVFLLPPMVMHLSEAARLEPATSFKELISRPTVIISYAMTATLMATGFLIIPNTPSYILANLHFPRAHYQYLLAVGGAASFVALRLMGRLVDRFGSFRVGTLCVVASLVVMYIYYVRPPDPAPVMLLYVTFMVTLGGRNVAYNALTTRVPRPRERARFLSLQSTVYHAAAGMAALVSVSFLRELPDGRLDGMPKLALASMALSATLPLFLWVVEARVRRAATTTRSAS